VSTDLSPLPELARRINAEHAACLDAAQTAVGKAMEVGRLLSEAKGQVRHGEWAGWVEQNCTFGIRQAQNYMRVHQNRDAIEGEMRNGASHLASLRGAIGALTEPSSGDPEPMSEGELARLAELERWAGQKRQETVAHLWDAGKHHHRMKQAGRAEESIRDGFHGNQGLADFCEGIFVDHPALAVDTVPGIFGNAIPFLIGLAERVEAER
jgi:hypothetical protein